MLCILNTSLVLFYCCRTNSAFIRNTALYPTKFGFLAWLLLVFFPTQLSQGNQVFKLCCIAQQLFICHCSTSVALLPFSFCCSAIASRPVPILMVQLSPAHNKQCGAVLAWRATFWSQLERARVLGLSIPAVEGA